MAVKIDDEMIDYVGILAKLSLSPEEKEAAKSDMSRMLEYIDMLNQLDTSEVYCIINLKISHCMPP